jgi:hypothetical protein
LSTSERDVLASFFAFLSAGSRSRMMDAASSSTPARARSFVPAEACGSWLTLHLLISGGDPNR